MLIIYGDFIITFPIFKQGQECIGFFTTCDLFFTLILVNKFLCFKNCSIGTNEISCVEFDGIGWIKILFYRISGVFSRENGGIQLTQ